MQILVDIPEHQYNNIMLFDSVNLGRVPYKGIIMYAINAIKHGRVLEQEPKSFQWCTDCKEYDQEKHCCHRWSKVIRDTVEEMKQEQEPRKGHLSIDDVMSVFDDFMCGEVDEDGTAAFLEMLKDKAESEV